MQKDFNYGVLSQTLSSSPCIKTVLPARIRSPLLNDVVLVGHSSIHLREFAQTGHLSNILADLEIGVQILAAKVISAEEHVLSTEDAILENGRDEIRYKIGGVPCDESQPPQIVVLSVASSELIFAYAKNLPNGSVQFIHAKRGIIGTLQWPLKYGRHLAIDSESRALAIGAAKGSFGLMSLKHVGHIRSDIDSWNPRNPTSMRPVNEQRFIKVDGTILRMDFLRSSTLDPHRVVLLLIVANQGTTRLLLYRWDSWRSLATAKPLKCSGQPLPVEDSFPHLLIPSCRWTSFAIVTGPKIVFYDDVNSRCLKRSSVDLSADKDKQWVQYAKPVRHEEHKKKKEDIFLVREDGLLRTVVVTHNSDARSSIAFHPGHLGINVDSAVCALSAPPTMGGDILIACGDTTEGGVFHLAARQPPELIQPLPNWTPVNDIVHIEGRQSGSAGQDHGSVLAATGIRKDRAFLSELRHGTEAQIAWTMQYEEVSSVDRLWAFEQPSEKRLLLLISHYEHTSLLCYDIEESEIAIEDATNFPQLSFEFPTLVARWIPGGALLQVTTHGLHLFSPTTTDQRHPLAEFIGNFICADIEPLHGIFVVAIRQDSGVQLSGGIVVDNPQATVEFSSIPEARQIQYVPIDVNISTLGDKIVCLTASQIDQVYLYQIDIEHGFVPLAEWRLEDLDQSLAVINLSCLSVLALSGSKTNLVICGSKTGRLILLELGQDNTSDANLSFLSSYSIGTTAVRVASKSASASSNEVCAYITCASTVLQIRLYRSNHALDYTVDSLFVTNRFDPSYLPASVHAIDRIETTGNTNGSSSGELLICAAGEDIHLLEVGHTTTAARPIRHIQPTGHLVYSRHLRKCVIGLQESSPHSQAALLQSGERPSLQLIEPNTLSDNETALPRSRFYFGEKGEKLRLLYYWQPTNGESHFDMVIIGTDLNGTGRLAYMSTTRMMQAKVGVSAKFFATYPSKRVNAVCSYGQSSLVVCAGRELKLVHLDMATKKFQFEGTLELPSRALELKAKGSVIYVATSLHSFMLIREEGGQLRHMGSDAWAGKARNIIPYGPSSTLVNIVTDRGTKIVNFQELAAVGGSPSFEARIPQALDRMVHLKLRSRDDGRDRFLGTAIDGSVYLFTTLSEAEMQLLSFLERLCEPMRTQAAKEASILARQIARKLRKQDESTGSHPPQMGKTHAQGDVLQGLLRPGPHNIYFLLQKRVKLEDDDNPIKQEDEVQNLVEISQPVIGRTDDVVEGVAVWLRRLLNVPSF